VPEIHDLLDEAAVSLRPTATPPFDVVARRARRRRTRSVAAGALAAVAVVGTSALLLLPGGDDALSPPVALAPQAAPPGSVAEPTPYAVPTTPATDDLIEVAPRPLLELAGEDRSVPWTLIRLWDDGRRVSIRYSNGCDHTPADVRAVEAPEYVVVQVVEHDRVSNRTCAASHRATIVLTAPLGTRQLLHAPVPGFPTPRYSLADHFENAPAHPGLPWTKDGREVPAGELRLAAGPEHCNWQEAAFLGGTGLPAPRDARGGSWTRDPKGVLDHFPQSMKGFRASATLPDDAAPTVYTQGPVELWTAPSDGFEYVYLVNADDRTDVERWVRGGGGCA
jgi:hypothetical protein